MKYADKRQHTVTCTERDCDEDATKLVGVGGRPFWVCDEHWEQWQRDRG
jgi:hypothetical protein